MRDLRRWAAIRIHLVLENLALQHQKAVFEGSPGKRLRLTDWDRRLWVWLSRHWPGWRSALCIVKPETVQRWTRMRVPLRRPRKVGRPPIPDELQQLIRRMSRENYSWGAPRIHGELAKLGFRVSQTTVAKYMLPRSERRGPTWRTFIRLHLPANLADLDPRDATFYETLDRHRVDDTAAIEIVTVHSSGGSERLHLRQLRIVESGILNLRASSSPPF